MRTGLARIGALAIVLWFQFTVYPGHSYVQSASQIYVPQLEHLESPGFLTRDLTATNPNLTFTVFDEASLSLHRGAHLEFPAALAAQQIVCRLAGLSGIFLLAGAAGLPGWWPLLMAAGVGFAGNLPAIGLSPFGLEPTPAMLAFGWVLLAAGLFAHTKPLLSGFMGGLALLYDPCIAAPFWIALLLALFFDRSLRPSVRATLPLLAVFALLLANFAQLQPSPEETRGLFSTIPPAVEAAQRFRTPDLWITQWPARDLLFYVALIGVTTWAIAYLWASLSRPLRWLLAGLPLAGVVGVALSVTLLGHSHLRAAPLLQPARNLVFTAILGALTCAVAARKSKNFDRWLFASVPLLLLLVTLPPPSPARPTWYIDPAASWARNNTWGAAMFLFPDVGKSAVPGAFRALSLRPVWTDWETGSLCDSSDSFAIGWHGRWQDTMAASYKPEQLPHLLTLPIDYLVLSPRHAITAAKPAYRDAHWLIYDTADLRNLSKSIANSN